VVRICYDYLDPKDDALNHTKRSSKKHGVCGRDSRNIWKSLLICQTHIACHQQRTPPLLSLILPFGQRLQQTSLQRWKLYNATSSPNFEQEMQLSRYGEKRTSDAQMMNGQNNPHKTQGPPASFEIKFGESSVQSCPDSICQKLT